MSEENSLIQKLKNKYDDARVARRLREEAERPLKERIQTIFSAPRNITTDFWCDVCKKDCTGMGHRQVSTLRAWAPTAWFVGQCPKGHKIVRRITDKNTDPYYDKSVMVKRHRWDMRDDFITPDNPRFKQLYPDKYKELMEKNNG